MSEYEDKIHSQKFLIETQRMVIRKLKAQLAEAEKREKDINQAFQELVERDDIKATIIRSVKLALAVQE